MTRYYRDLTPTFTDRRDWTLPRVLGHWAERTPDAIWLDAPEESATWTYAETAQTARNIARSFMSNGGQQGDRVVIMAKNSSSFVFTWFGCSFAGMVEVPINTAYEKEFLAHQVRTVTPRFAVIDDTFAQRFIDIGADADSIEVFWVLDAGARASANE